MPTAKHKKLWGGRFNAATNPEVEAFTESVSFDCRLARYDIIGSCAHARMLADIGVLTKREAATIVKGLQSILADIENGTFVFHCELEDVHMNIEAALAARIGAVGKKLHTGRSRNDQVALDERLWLRDILAQLQERITLLQEALLSCAQEHKDLIMPGFTHLRYAMPVLVAHHLLSYMEFFERDAERLMELYARVNILPLGAAALAGSSFALDREAVAAELGFDGVSRNSMDTVADRDYLVEFLALGALIGMHCSRVAEDLILWSSEPFGFITIDDAFCTGSSLMPHKKNPDVLELIRGKSGRLYGNLVALLTVMKGLPMTYNRDLQEDKEPVFDTADTLVACLGVLGALFGSIRFNAARLEQAVSDPCLLATDWAEYLVRGGMPFRDAHELVGKAVALAERRGCGLTNLPLETLRALSPAFDKGILALRTAAASVKAKQSFGSTQPRLVCREVARWKRLLSTRRARGARSSRIKR
jgi:argininosuccinate lyase